MIIISASLPKSGSTLIANVQEDLLSVVAPRSGQSQLRKAFGGRFIGALTLPVVARLLTIHARHGDIMVKTHSSATPLVRALIRGGVARATYCFRDPRDVILSSIDHGNRSRRGEDPSRAFIQYSTVEDSLPLVQGLVARWQSWERFGQANFIRYEDLMADKPRHIGAMSTYLGWQLSASQLTELLARHEPKRGRTHNFNKGTAYRYRTEMSEAQIALCTSAFHDILARNGYTTTPLATSPA